MTTLTDSTPVSGTNPNMPAFPRDHRYDGHNGINIRDYFAAKAMQANLTVIREFPDERWRDGLARDAYRMADAMLNAREGVL